MLVQEDILNFLFKEKIISRAKFAYLLLLQDNKSECLIEFIKSHNLVKEEDLVKTFSFLAKLEILNIHTAPITLLNYDKHDNYLKYRYLHCKDSNGNEFLAVNSLSKFTYEYIIKEHKALSIKLIKKKDFYILLEQNFSKNNNIKACFELAFNYPNISAKNNNYKAYIATFLFTLIAIAFISYNTVIFMTHLFFLSSVLFKCGIFIRALKLYKLDKANANFLVPIKSNGEYNKLLAGEYPIYSLLIPLYKEYKNIPTLLKAIANLNYPKDRLDVKILLEEDDFLSHKIFHSIELPSYIHLIKVPESLPKTKPKALNYGIQYAIGEYIVIYDAEDLPEPDQLQKAIKSFRDLPEEYVCLQASLNFYNKSENLLTKLCSIEYFTWFDYFLKALSSDGLPIPLGGTSNHFKTQALRKLGCWDPYNVTEDAELGLRIFYKGYKSKFLESITFEESVIDIKSWLMQRARWIKGFIITYIIFNKNYRKSIFSASLGDFSVDTFMGFGTLSFILAPLIFIIPFNEDGNYISLINNISITIFFLANYMFAISVVFNKKDYSLSFTRENIFVIMIWPLYFILHSIAAYIAIFQLIRQPFKWNKTNHGISQMEIKYNDRSI